MNRVFLVTTLTAAVLLSGCATPDQLPTHQLGVNFDAASASQQLMPGTNTVKGNAFMRQQGGGVVTCAGSPAYLVPATDYANARFLALYGNVDDTKSRASTKRFRFQPDAPEYIKLTKQATCDSQGNFIFEHVADGAFYVTTTVRWQAGNSSQGGNMAIKVIVKNGQTAAVVLAA